MSISLSAAASPALTFRRDLPMDALADPRVLLRFAAELEAAGSTAMATIARRVAADVTADLGRTPALASVGGPPR